MATLPDPPKPPRARRLPLWCHLLGAAAGGLLLAVMGLLLLGVLYGAAFRDQFEEREQRFAALTVGMPRSEVEAQLGQPDGVVSLAAGQQLPVEGRPLGLGGQTAPGPTPEPLTEPLTALTYSAPWGGSFDTAWVLLDQSGHVTRAWLEID